MKKYKVVLFDLDGTLTDPYEGITKCVQYALETKGMVEQDEARLRSFIGPPLDNSFRDFYGFSEEEAWELVAKYRERYNDIGKFENVPYEGIHEVLAALKKMGIKIGLATSKPEPQATDIMHKYELAQYFDVMTGSNYENTLHEKYQVILECLKRLGIEKNAFEDVLMVGDRKFDLIGAKIAGIDALGVKYGYAPEGELEQENPVGIVNTMTELKKWLQDNCIDIDSME